jgi:DNA-binding beta-propeller fold protein YncE
VDPGTGRIRQEVVLPAEGQTAPAAVPANILTPDPRAKLSFTGLVFSPDGARLFLANVNGSIKVFAVGPDQSVTPSFTIPLPPAHAPGRQAEIPAGLAVSPDGRRLYVALNLSNGVAEVEIETGKVSRRWDVGVAPYDVALVRGRLYVSNWGGRRPEAGEPAGLAGQGVPIGIDARTSVAREGSVSVIDLSAGTVVHELVTGRHASGLAVHPSGDYVVCACAADDFLAVIGTGKDEIVEKIWPKRTPADVFGASPNALTFSGDGKTLYVCNGTQNAVAVVEFAPGRSELEGLLPTGWYPGGIAFDGPRRRLHVANLKGLGSWQRLPPVAPRKYITGNQFGTLSLIDLPLSKPVLKEHTGTVLANARGPALQAALLPARQGMRPRPVPERSGEPSVFKHVLYIIKENRTYDQVLGDVKGGNGDPGLCLFPEKITPNQHALARDFVLLDNFYVESEVSADGHEWTMGAYATDFVEKNWPLSYGHNKSGKYAYPSEGGFPIARPAGGYLWDRAAQSGVSFRSYGEWVANGKKPGDPAVAKASSLEGHFDPLFRSFDMDYPDVKRAEHFLGELARFEKEGEMPRLQIVRLPNDHTSGTSPGKPTPTAQVADNDLALGLMVEGLSKSRFWSRMAIFVVEDDAQNGSDHVDAHRTIAFAISPYIRRGSVDSTMYSTSSMLRTMELILGLSPMSQFDAAAMPMFASFQAKPDLTPFKARPAQVNLEERNGKTAWGGKASQQMDLSKEDAADDLKLNEIIWKSVRGADSAMPAPRRAAFVFTRKKVHDDDDDDDDE